MHYKNGREAKNGDKVVRFIPVNDPTPNLKECLRADDVQLAVDQYLVPPGKAD